MIGHSCSTVLSSEFVAFNVELFLCRASTSCETHRQQLLKCRIGYWFQQLDIRHCRKPEPGVKWLCVCVCFVPSVMLLLVFWTWYHGNEGAHLLIIEFSRLTVHLHNMICVWNRHTNNDSSINFILNFILHLWKNVGTTETRRTQNHVLLWCYKLVKMKFYT